MIGIVSFGAYVPRYRLRRDSLAQALGVRSLGGERAVCNHDEDALTLSVEALADAWRGLGEKEADGLFFASTTAPYREKASAAVVAAALEVSERALTADFGNTIRCGTAALRAAADAVAAGSARCVLVSAADTRHADVRTDLVQLFGDASAAFAVGDQDVVVAVEKWCSVAGEFTDYWRRQDDRYVQVDDAPFAHRYGYLATMRRAVERLVCETGASLPSFHKVVFNAPDPRSHAELAKVLGLDSRTQVQDPFFQTVGNAGCASALLSLVGALQGAKQGDRILLMNYGDGCDAASLVVLPGIGAVQQQVRGVSGYLPHRRELDVGRFMEFRKLLG